MCGAVEQVSAQVISYADRTEVEGPAPSLAGARPVSTGQTAFAGDRAATGSVGGQIRRSFR